MNQNTPCRESGIDRDHDQIQSCDSGIDRDNDRQHMDDRDCGQTPARSTDREADLDLLTTKSFEIISLT